MNRYVLAVAGLALVALAALTPALASAQTTPTCSQALDQLAVARAMPVGDVAAKQVVLDQIKAAQIVLDAAVVTAQKNLDTAVPGTVDALTVALNTAKANAVAGPAKITAATAALVADQKLVADRDAAIKTAEAAVNKACRGADGAVTTVPVPTFTPAPTTTVPRPASVIPNAIDTGRA